ncbi:hypothetical protein GF358_03730, partial [Candidatus Woesearchaeota archaeon]|nr:hypothetical protein [Candidatus Woesearchaeota archaeon]
MSLEQIVNQPSQRKGLLGRMKNIVGGALLAGSLLLGAYMPGCVGREEEYVVWPDEQQTQQQDTTPPADVSNFTATAGNFSVDLSWMNPNDGDFAGVIIRRKTTDYPANPTDGTFVYTGKGQSYTDSGLTDVMQYYRIFTFDNIPNYSSGVTNSAKPLDNSPPANVGGFTATAGYFLVDLSWTNPSSSDFAGVKILRKTTGYPANPTDGMMVYTGTDQTYTDSGLAEAVNYYYTAFSFDEVPNYAGGRQATAQPYGGAFAIAWIGGGSNGWKTIDGASLNSDYRSFTYPSGLSIDSAGNIYIADRANRRISKWNSAGSAIGWIGGGSNGWKTTSGAAAGSDY